MAEFTYPPLTPDPDPSPLSPTIPLNPPMVGEVTPFDHVDGQNRDLILEAIRAWIRGPLRSWTTAWQTYLVYWLALVAGWLNTFVTEADDYITEHAIAGYSWRTTVTPIAASGTTTVVLAVDTNLRPLVLGDLVSDQEPNTRYGIITALVDATHATVTPLGVLQGNTGYGWWVTATAISASGPTDVVLPVETDRVPQVNDLVSDESSALRYGQITAIIDSTHATVTPLGVLRGLAGFGWWSTATDIAHSGTTAVVLSSGPDRLPQVNDLVIDESESSAYGEVTVVTDATHVTVAYVGTLQGPAGADGTPGIVSSIVAGANITVDSTDPANPIVSATGEGGGGVDSIVAGTNITVDATDPANPIVSASGGGGDTAFDTQTDLFAATVTVGDTYTVRNLPGLFWVALADAAWDISGIGLIANNDVKATAFDEDFAEVYFDGSGKDLFLRSLYSGITYKWTDSSYLPWDSDWIDIPAAIISDGFALGDGTNTGMMKFTSGSLQFRGVLTIGDTTSFDATLDFILDSGLFAWTGTDMPVGFSVIGDCMLYDYSMDGVPQWRGVVVNNGGDVPAPDYYLSIPDLASSGNFGNDIWAGLANASVNHAWGVGSVFEWSINLPIDPTSTYDDGRAVPGIPEGTTPGDYPATGASIIFPPTPHDNASLETTAQAGVGWNVTYGLPDADPEAIQAVGAVFSADNIIQACSADGNFGYEPAIGDAIEFHSIAGISGLDEDTPYYVNSVTDVGDPTSGFTNQFTVSATLGGSTATFTGTGTADTSTLLAVPAGTTLWKAILYTPVFMTAVPLPGFYFRPGSMVSRDFEWFSYPI